MKIENLNSSFSLANNSLCNLEQVLRPPVLLIAKKKEDIMNIVLASQGYSKDQMR